MIEPLAAKRKLITKLMNARGNYVKLMQIQKSQSTNSRNLYTSQSHCIISIPVIKANTLANDTIDANDSCRTNQSLRLISQRNYEYISLAKVEKSFQP